MKASSRSIVIKVRKPTDFGYVEDDMGNMPAMEVDDRRIRGTDASVKIHYAFGEHKPNYVLASSGRWGKS